MYKSKIIKYCGDKNARFLNRKQCLGLFTYAFEGIHRERCTESRKVLIYQRNLKFIKTNYTVQKEKDPIYFNLQIVIEKMKVA